MSFKNIRGQNRVIEFLEESIRSGHIAHAYIFVGPSGVGRKLTAINFACAVNCRGPLNTRPCGQCIQCRKVASSNHPDISILEPAKETSSIKIDAIREMIRDIGLKPYEGRKKFYVIDRADGMTEEASNAILKTLEEPPSDSVIVLIVENMNSLISTIVSRSQIVKFSPLSGREIKTILTKEFNVDDARAHVLSALACGSLGLALKFNDEHFFTKRSKVMDALSSGTLFDSDFVRVSKAELKTILQLAMIWYRDVLATKINDGDKADIINTDRVGDIHRLADKMTISGIQQVIENIVSTYSYLDMNANQKLAMTALGTKIAYSV